MVQRVGTQVDNRVVRPNKNTS